jgi:hypothetical protein
MRRTRSIANTFPRSRWARVGLGTSGRGLGAPGVMGVILPPPNFTGGTPPGSYKQASLGVPTHTHEHHALNGLADDDHLTVAYVRAPRAKLRVVAPTGAPYSSPKTAIEACNTGDCVLILAGTYTETTAITVPADDITIMGLNSEATIIHWNVNNATVFINCGAHDGIEIRNLTLQGDATHGLYAIQGSGADDLDVDNVHFDCDSLRFMNLPNCNRAHIRHCTMTGLASTQYGIVSGGAEVTIIDNRITADFDGAQYLLYHSTGDRAVIAGNTLRATGTNVTRCVYVWNTDYARILENHIEIVDPNAPYALYMLSLSDNVNVGSIIQGNIIIGDGDVGQGIFLNSAGNPHFLDDTQVSDNQVFNFANGVRVGHADVRESRVRDNNVHTCTTGIVDLGTNTDSVDNT